MSLIINGIDFDKRCDDEKRRLHEHIEFMSTVFALEPYFKNCHILTEKNDISIPEWIRRKGFEIRHRDNFIPLITSNQNSNL